MENPSLCSALETRAYTTAFVVETRAYTTAFVVTAVGSASAIGVRGLERVVMPRA